MTETHLLKNVVIFIQKIHLCNLFKNLKLLAGKMVICQPDQNQTHFLIQRPYDFYCSVLLYQNICLCKFLAIAVFYYKHRSIYTFSYLSKKVNFQPQKLVFLVVGYLKKKNAGSKQLRPLFLNCRFLSKLALIFDEFTK